MAPETCPNCGADVPPKARACPECGACDETGWSEGSSSAHLGMPDDSFNYDEYVKREFGPKRPWPQGMRLFWALVSLGLVLLLIWFAF